MYKFLFLCLGIYCCNISAAKKYPLVIETDIGTNPDDLLMLLMLRQYDLYPEILVVTSDEQDGMRLQYLKRVSQLFPHSFKISQGLDLGHKNFFCSSLLNKTQSLAKDTSSPLEGINAFLKQYKKIDYLAVGGVAFVASLLKGNTILPSHFNQLVVMAGTAKDEVETNAGLDIKAIATLLGASAEDLPLVWIFKEAALYNQLEVNRNNILDILDRMHRSNPISIEGRGFVLASMEAYFRATNLERFFLHDSVALAYLLLSKELFMLDSIPFEIDQTGRFTMGKGSQNSQIVQSVLKPQQLREEILNIYEQGSNPRSHRM